MWAANIGRTISIMAQIKDRSDSFIFRLDDAVDNWLKHHLPLMHRFLSWHAERMSRVSLRAAWIVGLIVLVNLIVSLLYQLLRTLKARHFNDSPKSNPRAAINPPVEMAYHRRPNRWPVCADLASTEAG